jgi:O-antigen chain-terminating methyltransferase
MTSNPNKHREFYRAFEDRFRGSRELIRSRLAIYTPFLDLVQKRAGDDVALDLGCGRGEWLELLRDRNFDATGVDLDESMLAACRERNLSVIKGDAIEYLKKIPDSSLTLISGFHVAEHLPFEKLQVLVYEAHRALKPGGILILETPNPENFQVSTLTFYLDPTHNHPIPPQLLSFLTEYYGFDRNKIVRLQELPAISNLESATLVDCPLQSDPS